MPCARRDDAHLGEDRPLAARRDERVGDALDPDAGAGARAALVGCQRLDREDAVRADVLTEPEEHHPRRLCHGTILGLEDDMRAPADDPLLAHPQADAFGESH